MPKENRTKFAILGMLDCAPMSGYDIRKMSAMSIAHFWKEDYGHIYPTLKLLQDEGLATMEEAGIGRGKARKAYIFDHGKGQGGPRRLARGIPEPAQSASRAPAQGLLRGEGEE